jgi:Zn-finger nucleic acid-binding protein
MTPIQQAVYDALVDTADAPSGEINRYDVSNLDYIAEAVRAVPIDMVLFCPKCHAQHIDRDEAKGMLAFDVAAYGEPWRNPPHRSHLCHDCGFVWRPADVPTNGVRAIKTRGKRDSVV